VKPLCFEASDEDEAAAYKSHLAGVVALSGEADQHHQER